MRIMKIMIMLMIMIIIIMMIIIMNSIESLEFVEKHPFMIYAFFPFLTNVFVEFRPHIDVSRLDRREDQLSHTWEKKRSRTRKNYIDPPY